MSFKPSSILLYGASFNSYMRTLGFKFFHRFGLHCATHQIRVILISAVVITSLFYPALAIYSSSQPRFLAQISSRLHHSFLVTETLASYHAFHDLRDVWTGHDPLRIREDSVALTRCGTDGILRVERILIHSALSEDPGTLNNQILLSTLKLERRIGDLLSSSNLPCLRKADGTCFVSSPIAFWDYDETKLSADTNILDTLQFSKNVTISGIPITPQMVLAGRESSGTADSSLDSAMFLVLTYIFHETDCSGTTGHSDWLRRLQRAAERRDYLLAETQQPRLIALEYKGTTRGYYSAWSSFTFLAYISLFIYGYELSRRTDKVHSKFGVVFTGMVELSVSTITSLSVCALAGFKITMVPWEIFPILVVFIGIENMFSLVDAVYKTSVALPVKQRIAEGLGRAGTSNSLKLVSYNVILGTLAFFSVGAIRQFCAFAIVVLVAHWFLVHTFFIAVLSIDLRRLELEELLQQGTNLAPSIHKDPPQAQAGTRWSKAARFIRNLLQSRANKNISLVLLLATTGVLYYSSQPSFTRVGVETRSQSTRGALSRSKPIAANNESQTPASHIWQLLNPKDDPLVHLRIESPTILILRPNIADSHSPTEPKLHHRSHFSVLTLEGLVWVLKIVMVPILATVGILYAVLLYLLKDAQLLEAQHIQEERDAPESPSVEPPVDDDISFTTIPRAFSTDVEMLAASKDGQVVATVGTQNEFVIWRVAATNQTHTTVDVTDLLLKRAGTSSATFRLTTLALSDSGLYCAVGTRTGVVAIWSIDNNHVKPLHQLSLEGSSFAVMDLHFITSPSTGSPTPISLLATYEDGTAVDWKMDGSFGPTRIRPSHPSLLSKCAIVSVPSRRTHMVAFFVEDGTLELCNVSPNADPTLEFCVPAGSPTDPVSLVHACDLEINGKHHTIVGAATKGGVVSVWDGETSECITTIDDSYGEVNNLRLSATKAKPCSFCGELRPDSFTISFSVGHILLVYRAYVFVGAIRKCSCPNHQPHQVSFKSAYTLGKRKSRRGSGAPSGTSSPLYSRSRHTSLSKGSSSVAAAAFPVSGHGVHSRRSSEKDSLRRAVESMALPIPTFESEELEKASPGLFSSPLEVSVKMSSPSSISRRSPLWENVVVARVADTTFERGRWDVVNGKIVGLRRKPRVFSKPKSSTAPWKAQLTLEPFSGLSPASLDRWELWMLDPQVPRIQASLLATLQRDRCTSSAPSDGHQSSTSSGSSSHKIRSDDSIPRLPFTRVSPFICGPSYCLAGLGNTVGLFQLGISPSASKKPRSEITPREKN